MATKKWDLTFVITRKKGYYTVEEWNLMFIQSIYKQLREWSGNRLDKISNIKDFQRNKIFARITPKFKKLMRS